jgi:predicted phosphodiesterase
VVAHAHGHQWRPGKHFEWWRGQAFSKTSAMHQADLLVAGHLHHEHVDSDGPRTFIQPPSMESESTWWRHAKGTTGAPGLVVAVTKDGRTDIKEVVRSE